MKKKILIIDDSSTSREYIKYCFYEFNEFIEILFAENTLKAKKILNEEDISLIFLDWNLPGENGIDFLMKIKNDESKKNIPVIMISGEHNKKEEVLIAVKNGINDFLIKPFNKRDLILRTLPYFIDDLNIKVFSQDKKFIEFINIISKKMKKNFHIINSLEELNEGELFFIDYNLYYGNKNKIEKFPVLINLSNNNDQKIFDHLSGNIQYITKLEVKEFYKNFIDLLFKTFSKKQILIISYSDTIRKIIKSISQKLNYIGIEAKDFIEGYRYVFNQYKDMHSIFIDYDEFDNLLNFLMKMEANIFFKDIKINVIGSDESTEKLRILAKYKINNYILKPFTLEEIVKKILD
ncbi:hypothetical protein JCM30566_12480 [Marinitoga arctica]